MNPCDRCRRTELFPKTGGVAYGFALGLSSICDPRIALNVYLDRTMRTYALAHVCARAYGHVIGHIKANTHTLGAFECAFFVCCWFRSYC